MLASLKSNVFLFYLHKKVYLLSSLFCLTDILVNAVLLIEILIGLFNILINHTTNGIQWYKWNYSEDVFPEFFGNLKKRNDRNKHHERVNWQSILPSKKNWRGYVIKLLLLRSLWFHRSVSDNGINQTSQGIVA